MTYEAFIANFPKQRKTQMGVMVKCPAHEDGTASLHICKAKDGGVLIKDFAGCSAEQIVAALGLSMKDLFAESAVKKFTPPAIRLVSKNDDVPEEKPVIEKIYSYEDANGKEAFQAIRMRPKSFRQRHQKDGQWVWNMDGVVRVLYRLPKLISAQTVWLTEGEKDVENLVALGFEATTNVGGSKSWLDSYAENFKDKEVIICGDNDKAGLELTEQVSKSVAQFAKSVRIVRIPKSVKDVSDYIATLKNPEEAKAALLDLASSAHTQIKGHDLPIYTIAELESDYRRFVRSLSQNAFSLGKWLPTLGVRLRSLVPGELVFIIGDTGVGKTGILQSISRAACPLPQILFELELPKELMFERFASMISKLSGEQIETAYQSSDESIAPLIDAKLPNLCVCPVARLMVRDMEQIIMHADLKLGDRPRVVLIDYIQLVSGDGINRREKISDIAEELKVMAKATRTIVIVASQIARPQNVDSDWEPSLHSAKESGSIESSCGLLISAWQDSKDSSVLNLRVLKSTKGGTGTFVKCNFDGARMIITEQSQFEEPDIPRQKTKDP